MGYLCKHPCKIDGVQIQGLPATVTFGKFNHLFLNIVERYVHVYILANGMPGEKTRYRESECRVEQRQIVARYFDQLLLLA